MLWRGHQGAQPGETDVRSSQWSLAQGHGLGAAGPAVRRLHRERRGCQRARVVASGAHSADTTLPDGTAVPTQAIEAPASVSTGDSLGLGLGGGDAAQIVSTASTSGIPSAALSAYQRAETVINSADKSCNLTWQLIAAIGRVESNHGRANGNVLDDNGLATPGIYGIALNGSNKTSEILDTDAGQYDNDTAYDRAVGPMQFIPSTWSVVGVDADGDGVRNPQDIDDAALGTAVYLCSGDDDLGTAAGRQSAVYRYNHSQSYVDLVLSIMEAYTLGDFTSVPNSISAGRLHRQGPDADPHRSDRATRPSDDDDPGPPSRRRRPGRGADRGARPTSRPRAAAVAATSRRRPAPGRPARPPLDLGRAGRRGPHRSPRRPPSASSTGSASSTSRPFDRVRHRLHDAGQEARARRPTRPTACQSSPSV